MLDHQGFTELAETIGSVLEYVEDSLSVCDAEPDALVTGGVRDEEERGGVHVAGVGQALGKAEDGEPVDRDAGEFHAPNMTRGNL